MVVAKRVAVGIEVAAGLCLAAVEAEEIARRLMAGRVVAAGRRFQSTNCTTDGNRRSYMTEKMSITQPLPMPRRVM